MRAAQLASPAIWHTIGASILKLRGEGPIVHLLKPIFEIEREQALGFAARRGFGLFVAQGRLTHSVQDRHFETCADRAFSRDRR